MALAAAPAPGGNASDLRWSFDAAWLSYSQDGSVHVVRADGTRDHVVTGAQSPVAWSPVTETLAFGVRDGKALDLAPATGEPTDLLLTGAGTLDSFAWSTDGSSLAYAIHPADPTAGDQLFSVSTDGGRYDRWAYMTPPDTGILLAGWQPDGQGVLLWVDVYHSGSRALDGLALVAVAKAGGKVTNLVTSRTYEPWLRWSPDHARLLVVEGAGREPWTTKSLTVCPMPAAACSPLPQPAGTVSLDPAWSPDGRQIAFVRAPAMSSQGSPAAGSDLPSWYPTRRLWVANADGTGAHEVPGAGPGVAAPSWSRDGATLRYSTASSISQIPASGGAPTQLAGPLSSGDTPDWALAGKQPWGNVAIWAPP